MKHAPVITGLEWVSERIPYPSRVLPAMTFPITWGADDVRIPPPEDPQWGCCSDDWGMDAEKIRRSPARLDEPIRTAMLPEFTGWGAEGPENPPA